ncbi:hypothetical protein VD0004_g1081 [Verticillium dahliae]|uniref:Enoyl reductase (ER) domain-containing protein n=1 Tax=Verticillium dahliae TaxID=27337 RepID=A0A444RMA3_VERDA|nr:hypothetical protein VD0004_g1081 [Verticillium dahliae]PNH76768.1 hypothetical protein VD0001_g799 [Verticillium dahliae]RXG42242.1 hypothetical protein VDGE_07223 [Verticillium dahliae]
MTSDSKMRAWIHKHKNLPLERGLVLDQDHAKPPKALKPTQILVRVRAVGINPADPLFAEMTGLPGTVFIKPTPLPGLDYSGEVVATGSGVSVLRAGDRVFGRVDTQKSIPGTMAEFTVSELEGCVAMPPSVSFEQAAGVGTAAMTAYESIVLNTKAGDSVFINGGTGGVGTYGIQFAKAHGLRVTVSASTAKVALCADLGADEVIDYRTQDLVATLKAKGQVFDLVADFAYREEADLYRAADDFIKKGGKYVMVPGQVDGSTMRTIAKNSACPSMLGGGKAKFEAYFAKSNRAGFEQIAEWMANGQVKTVVDSVFAFENMPKAVARVKSGSSTGKVIVTV